MHNKGKIVYSLIQGWDVLWVFPGMTEAYYHLDLFMDEHKPDNRSRRNIVHYPRAIIKVTSYENELRGHRGPIILDPFIPHWRVDRDLPWVNQHNGRFEFPDEIY